MAVTVRIVAVSQTNKFEKHINHESTTLYEMCIEVLPLAAKVMNPLGIQQQSDTGEVTGCTKWDNGGPKYGFDVISNGNSFDPFPLNCNFNLYRIEQYPP